jgi:hypothetical protein
MDMVKKGKRGKKKSKHQVTPKKPVHGKTTKKGIKPSKVFIYALALAAVGGGGYLVYDQIKRKKLLAPVDDNQDRIIINNNLPASYATVNSSARSSRSSASDSFPLKRGSSGSRVTMLQQALAKIIGTSAMNANGGIDGQFGPGTANALKMAGYPDSIDETTFNKITGSTSSDLTVVFNPKEIANTLYRNAQSKNLQGVLTTLQKIASVPDYTSVNDYYKKVGFVSKTIVTDLLDFAFKGSESSKEQIRNEFLRIGLKVSDTGRWSLQGMTVYKDIITLRETIVTDPWSNRIPVRKNTILGDEVKVSNGITWFRSIDNSILKVPSQDVKYT